MTYRPSISSEIDERVDLYMAGKTGNKNEVYERAIKLIIDENGKEHEWLPLLIAYSENTDQDIPDVLNQIIKEIIDDDGEPNIQFKERLDLD